MGCFDTVSIPCPRCGHHTQEQSKVGECTMQSYSLREAPPLLLADIAQRNIQCSYCKADFLLELYMHAIPTLTMKG